MITIKDVARHAGVSMSTVSYVLSGKRPISPATSHRVRRSIRELGFHPHAGARALASSRTRVLALVVPLRTDLDLPVIMQFVTSILTTARAHDHDVLLLTKESGADEVHRVIASSRADAVLVMDVEADDPRLPSLRALEVPVVLVGVPADASGLSCVDLDFTASGARMVAHLADLGHRSIGMVGSPPAVYERGTGYASRFLAGVTDCARRRGVEVHVHPCAPTQSALSECLYDLLRPDRAITGLIVHNEAVLGGLVQELRRRGRRVPEDLSVIALCPDTTAAAQQVPLTSIAVPAAEVGVIAVETLMRGLAGERSHGVRLLAPHLTERGSTAVR
ncbi:DNA-binding transcriptional regulator, LacI/PurR family [Lentzea fradiae]|uniref:DNA-binding transcriptional regulator, LacI/PurR family n=1 Tax=Lentzea fradiae TaxID=200378 RepID=A0A1G7VLU5_9PSEU|nr:LacI family DNA-binding transcriptional regulator [Lentzea fradiae]SDG60796.1 DNA-binding transcriptional regulator, LacI/PurR family [Lentzea fradiae]